MFSNKFNLYFLIVLWGFGLNISCDQKMPEVCRDYYAQPSYERERAFRTYTLNKQLDIYRCATHRRPPELGLASYIADGGENAIPLLLERLKAETDEPTQVNIIFVFELMSNEGYLRGRQDVVEQIKQVVTSMRYSVTAKEAQESLDKIMKKV